MPGVLGLMSVWRDCLGASLLTIGCNRPDKGEFQLCDFFLDDDVRGGYEQFRGGATVLLLLIPRCRRMISCAAVVANVSDGQWTHRLT